MTIAHAYSKLADIVSHFESGYFDKEKAIAAINKLNEEYSLKLSPLAILSKAEETTGYSYEDDYSYDTEDSYF